MTINPLQHPVCLEYPIWIQHTSWAEHAPFAMYIVSALRPRVLVELGVYRGFSYFTFCQAVKKAGLETKCYGFDTWEGDNQAGAVMPEDLAKIKSHHDPLYGSFSELVRSTFDGAINYFGDGSVDLLHIDGFHSYESVRHDFETWLPKMSRRGVILFHDVNVRQMDFGVWKFWEEVTAKYKHLTFLHGHGLGVLAVGDEYPEDVQKLFEADEAELVVMRTFFHQFGARIEAVQRFGFQCEEFAVLKSYETLVRKSRVLRVVRVLEMEGIGGIVKRIRASRAKHENNGADTSRIEKAE